jgi:hypothetical protein
MCTGWPVHAYRQGVSVGLVDFDHPGGEDFTIDPTDYTDSVLPTLTEQFGGLGELRDGSARGARLATVGGSWC